MVALPNLKPFLRRQSSSILSKLRRLSLLDLAQRHPQRLDVLAIAVSLVLHFLLIGGYLTWKPVVFAHSEKGGAVEEREKLLAFRLVETPRSAEVEQPPEKASAVSDKNARAQNRQAPDNLPEDEAFSPNENEIFAAGEPQGVESGKAVTQQSEPAQRATASQNAVSDGETATKRDGRLPTVLRRFAPPKFSREAIGQPMQPEVVARAGGGQSESKSRFIGDFSLNTYAWDYAPYILYMKRRMASNLYPPPAFTRLGIIHGSVVLHFKVMPNGEVRDLEVESYDCHRSLVETSLQAVRNSSPFKPLPRDFPEPYLELRWTFMYVVYGPDGRPQ